MYNITLISTHHLEIGKCNSEELYKIIESINPEVIFEELPNNLFNVIYNGTWNEAVTEIKCVKKYLQNHNIKHIPIDSSIRYTSDDEKNWMFDTFEKYDDYNKISNEQFLLTEQYGFDYINSDKCLELSEQTKVIEKTIMESDINKKKLFRIYQLFRREDDARENAMLQNICNYSKENQYNQAVFLIGAGHRKSIMQKIIDYEKASKIKLNWAIYGNSVETATEN